MQATTADGNQSEATFYFFPTKCFGEFIIVLRAAYVILLGLDRSAADH